MKHNLEAAVSFKSTKEITKRYKNFLDNITLGFECEVAAGALSIDDNSDEEIDWGEERAKFEANFQYTKSTFLSGKKKDAAEIIEDYEVESTYGCTLMGIAAYTYLPSYYYQPSI